MKTLITYKFTDDKLKKIEDLGYDVILEPERSLRLTEENKDIDILVTSEGFDKINLDDFPKLKWIQLLTTGVNQVPKDKILSRDILLSNNKLGYNIPIGEWIVLKILEMAKNSKGFYRQQEEKNWNMVFDLNEIYGKTVGFLGTGDIAKEASKRLKGFGVNIIGINSSGKPTEGFNESYSIDEAHRVIGDFDYMVITLPYTKDTHGLVDHDFLSKLKDGVRLVNIARGTIIDEKALIEALESGKVTGAALDVFEKEPLPKDSPLWTMDKVIVTPHNSWNSEMFEERRFQMLYENLKRYKNQEEILNIVDLNRGY